MVFNVLWIRLFSREEVWYEKDTAVFDISQAGGKGGEWYFWGRVINPSNLSDWLVVDGYPGDKIPALKGKDIFNIQGVVPQRNLWAELGSTMDMG